MTLPWAKYKTNDRVGSAYVTIFMGGDQAARHATWVSCCCIGAVLDIDVELLHVRSSKVTIWRAKSVMTIGPNV
jgi:hypothetical protein